MAGIFHNDAVLQHRGWGIAGECFKCKQTLGFGTRWVWEKGWDCGKEQASLEDMPWKTALCQVFFNMSQQGYEKKKVQVDLLEGL